MIMSDPILREEFDRVLESISRSEVRMTARIDDGFERVNGRVREMEVQGAGLMTRVITVERVVFAGAGLVLTGVGLAILNLVLSR